MLFLFSYVSQALHDVVGRNGGRQHENNVGHPSFEIVRSKNYNGKTIILLQGKIDVGPKQKWNKVWYWKGTSAVVLEKQRR